MAQATRVHLKKETHHNSVRASIDERRKPASPPPWLGRLLVCGVLMTGCADALPDDLKDYRDRCVLMNPSPLPERDDDPHRGTKDVYACDVSLTDLRDGVRPFPDGTVIVKESTRTDADYPWLVATAEKIDGSWTWAEYSRNFANEEFLHILATEDVCIDCHKKVESVDWIYTFYRAPSN
jgi:hypothetical protein